MKLSEQIIDAAGNLKYDCGHNGHNLYDVFEELSEKAAQLEGENAAFKRYVEAYHDEDFVMWCREQDALLTE